MTMEECNSCSKEGDLTDMKLLMLDLKKDVGFLVKAMGDKDKGLIKEVVENTNYITRAKERAGFVKFMVGSGWGIAVILMVKNLINR